MAAAAGNSHRVNVSGGSNAFQVWWAAGGDREDHPSAGSVEEPVSVAGEGAAQKALLKPLIDRRLERASGELGRVVHQATSVLDDRSVTNRIADLQQDASLSWQDPAHLRLLGRIVVDELRYQGERKGWDAGRTDTAVCTGPAISTPARSRPRSSRIPSARRRSTITRAS